MSHFERIFFSERAFRIALWLAILMCAVLLFMMVTDLVDTVSRNEDARRRGGEATYEQARELRDSPSLRPSKGN
jgi:hypothetical protein